MSQTAFNNLSGPSMEHLRNLLFNRKEHSVTCAQILAKERKPSVIYLRNVPVKFRKWDRIISKKSKAQSWSTDQTEALLEAIAEQEQNNICPLSFPIKSEFDAILNFIYSVAFTDLVKQPIELDPCGLQGVDRSIAWELTHEILVFLEQKSKDKEFAWSEPKVICEWRELQKKCTDQVRC